MITGEHEFEASFGLPEPLPRNERLLWQGRPDTAAVTRDVTHWRGLAVYFGLLVVWRVATVLHDGGGPGAAIVAGAWLLPLAAVAIGVALGLGALVARTTAYTITDRRIVMRIGIVLTLTFNLPFTQIAGVTRRQGSNGCGDLALQLMPGNRIAYLNLWPHARPWQLRQPQPMLRALPQVAEVAALLTEALRAAPAAPVAGVASGAPAANAPNLTSPAAPLRPEARAA